MLEYGMTTLGKRIAEAREELGLSQKELAELVGLESGQAVSAWERDANGPSRERLLALAEALQVQFLWLTKGEGPKRSKNVTGDNSSLIQTAETQGQAHQNGEPALDEYEREVIESYRGLDEVTRAEVRGYLRGLRAGGHAPRPLSGRRHA